MGDGEKPVEDHSCIASSECLRVFTLGVVFLLDENRKNNNAEVSTEPRSSRVAAIRNCVTVRETNGRTDGRTDGKCNTCSGLMWGGDHHCSDGYIEH